MSNKKRVDNPKPPRRFYTKRDDGTLIEQDVWCCGECNLLTIGSHTKEAAENCCKKKYCECGSEIDRDHYLQCTSCMHKVKEEKRTTVEYDGGPLCEIDGDRYFADEDELLDHYESMDEEPPEYAHPCDKIKWSGLPESCIDDAIENEACSLFEDAEDHMPSLEPLYKAVRKWNEGTNVVYWQARVNEQVSIKALSSSGSSK